MPTTITPTGRQDMPWIIEIDETVTAAQMPTAIEQALAAIADDPAGPPPVTGAAVSDSNGHRDDDQAWIQLWIAAADDARTAAAVEAGFEPYRDLWQLRVSLPLANDVLAAAGELATRAFRPPDSETSATGERQDDVSAFIEVNNRAFAWHPEQGGMTRADVAARMAEPWFDPDIFRIHEVDGRMAGFNWLKIHQRSTGGQFDPPMGEIYVIAVDPDFHGRGLGTRLSVAGLQHLAAMGISRAMLYVESDNGPANAVYERIGYRRHQTNRAFRRPLR